MGKREKEIWYLYCPDCQKVVKATRVGGARHFFCPHGTQLSRTMTVRVSGRGGPREVETEVPLYTNLF